MSAPPPAPALAQAIADGDRRALARAITLVESTKPEHRVQADALLAEIRRAPPANVVRVGISGPPGARMGARRLGGHTSWHSSQP